jgi:putative transposase
MKGRRYPEEQIIGILREVESGVSIAEVCRKHGVSEWSVYRWRTKYRGMDVSEAKRLRALEDENARLKRIVAQQAIDIDALKQVLSKKW